MIRAGVGVQIGSDRITAKMAMERAILQEGKKFISLRLIEMAANRIQGAIVLQPKSYFDSVTNIMKYQFEEGGGQLRFEVDNFKGGYFCRMLDCEHNRNILASVFYANLWEIEDKEVETDIKERMKNLKEQVIIQKSEVPQEKGLSDDEIDNKIARLQQESSRRKIERDILLSKRGGVLESLRNPTQGVPVGQSMPGDSQEQGPEPGLEATKAQQPKNKKRKKQTDMVRIE